MAHKKGQGSSQNGRDSAGQRLGCKRFSGQFVTAGSILVRQRGTKFKPGRNVGMGKDDTLFAKINGIVKYEGKDKGRRFISVLEINSDKSVAETVASQTKPVGASVAKTATATIEAEAEKTAGEEAPGV